MNIGHYALGTTGTQQYRYRYQYTGTVNSTGNDQAYTGMQMIVFSISTVVLCIFITKRHLRHVYQISRLVTANCG
jgi:hypothetical protein